ncbi:MAG TPA: hypothetical protein VIK22_03990 [Candidatus Anoxymicrobiaceae bacterium]|jgi:hypothetical protein
MGFVYIISGGLVYDGTGARPVKADTGINGELLRPFAAKGGYGTYI